MFGATKQDLKLYRQPSSKAFLWPPILCQIPEARNPILTRFIDPFHFLLFLQSSNSQSRLLMFESLRKIVGLPYSRTLYDIFAPVENGRKDIINAFGKKFFWTSYIV